MGILSTQAIFAVVFLMVVLCFVCIVMAIRVSGAGMRLTFLGAALVLCAMMGVFCLTELQMQNMEKPAPKAQEEQPVEKKKPAVPSLSGDYGSVELRVDEATVPKNVDELKQPERLDLEKGLSGNSPQRQQERRRIGHQLTAIEEELIGKLSRLDAQKQEISAAQAAGTIDNYDALLKIAQIKLQQAKLVEIAMHEKLSVLKETKELTEQDIGPDRERIQKRLAEAQRKQQEYNEVISKVSENSEVFHKL